MCIRDRATIVESDEVLVDFSLTALDYLRSQQRNVTLGEKDANRSWQPSVTITLADNSVYPLTGIVDFALSLIHIYRVNPETISQTDLQDWGMDQHKNKHGGKSHVLR